ncbi:MAG TPA: PAS domain-containing sensor histidine kinase, partial [Pseudomonas sp.]|nr:PAS domain-containing sensor histidine kinase [Pseudomonas sp.]HCL42270.1 PAS domain-containing sensor histidine kinase [Pseudomonas sp.]
QLLNESDLLSRQDLRLTEIIQQHSQRMNRVIETVLELSRRRPSEPQLLDLALWTSAFLQDFRAAHPATDSIDCEIEKEGILTRIDPNQLTQVVSNLCQNALRYSGEPGTPRTIYLHLYLHPDTQLPTLEIIDHGPGVASEHVGHIFEPFYTTENSGTGLGLYISRELCESNQARLECDSVEPHGCCMRITFAHPKRLV